MPWVLLKRKINSYIILKHHNNRYVLIENFHAAFSGLIGGILTLNPKEVSNQPTKHCYFVCKLEIFELGWINLIQLIIYQIKMKIAWIKETE